jgi:hypothetical protein
MITSSTSNRTAPGRKTSPQLNTKSPEKGNKTARLVQAMASLSASRPIGWPIGWPIGQQADDQHGSGHQRYYGRLVRDTLHRRRGHGLSNGDFWDSGQGHTNEEQVGSK